jgi:toxin HigB-1
MPLKRFWEQGDPRGVDPQWIDKVRLVLDALENAVAPEELDIVGFGFHPLAGNRAGRYAVTVTRNWRFTFGWSGENAIDVDLEDDHGRRREHPQPEPSALPPGRAASRHRPARRRSARVAGRQAARRHPPEPFGSLPRRSPSAPPWLCACPGCSAARPSSGSGCSRLTICGTSSARLSESLRPLSRSSARPDGCTPCPRHRTPPGGTRGMWCGRAAGRRSGAVLSRPGGRGPPPARAPSPRAAGTGR